MDKEIIRIVTEKRSDAIDVCNKELIFNLEKNGVNAKVIFLDNKKFKNSLMNFFLEIINTIRIIFIVKKDEIVLFTDPLSFNSIASLFISNKKYVIFYHYEKDPFYYKYLPFISYKKLLNGFDGIACISNFSLSQLNSLGVNNDKGRVIYYGINHELFKPSVPLQQYSFEYILSVGSEEPRKNMKNILKAFKMLKTDFPKLKLLKVGKVSPENRKKTISYMEKFKLDKESIIFTDYIEENDLPKIYSGAKFLLFPSLLEGFGLPVVEAMACGCPVITSDRNPMKELVGSTQIIVDPLDQNYIAASCRKILLDNEVRERMNAGGLVRARKFSWENTAINMYRFMIKSVKK